MKIILSPIKSDSLASLRVWLSKIQSHGMTDETETVRLCFSSCMRDTLTMHHVLVTTHHQLLDLVSYLILSHPQQCSSQHTP